jgi:ABC-type branched-subunit amino acid transport system permease subunit
MYLFVYSFISLVLLLARRTMLFLVVSRNPAGRLTQAILMTRGRVDSLGFDVNLISRRAADPR